MKRCITIGLTIDCELLERQINAIEIINEAPVNEKERECLAGILEILTFIKDQIIEANPIQKLFEVQ